MSALTLDSVEITRAVASWNAALDRGARTGWRGHARRMGRKYIYLDEEVNGEEYASGHFLIVRTTGDIYQISSYGRPKGARIMNLSDWFGYWARAKGHPSRLGVFSLQTGGRL